MNCGKTLIAMSLLGLWAMTAAATEIYSWTDADGVAHYSDTKPSEETPVRTLVVNRSNPPDYDPADDPYSIANQAKRTNERYAEVEKAREERAEERETLAAQQPLRIPVYYDPYAYYRPGYVYRPGRPVRPERPPARQFPTIRRQARAMDELGLSGDRPHSINSSAHHARVESSSNFLNTVREASPPPRPVPR
jgi:hypothetical protein